MRLDNSLSSGPRTDSGAVRDLRRLGRNLNGYSGETIDIAAVLEQCRSNARGAGWTSEELIADAASGLSMPAFHRVLGGDNRVRVYISAGIHGDEPAGPLAAQQLLSQQHWPGHIDLWICPCLNPTGFPANRRENRHGQDLNRQYRQPEARETIAHIGYLERQPPFDLCLCLHEDWESQGFYLYELNPDGMPSLAESIIARVARVCPIDRSAVIDGRNACDGIIRPQFEPRLRPIWPEAFFLLMHKTRLSYTLEAPSDFELPTRVAALVAATEAALELAGGIRGR